MRGYTKMNKVYDTDCLIFKERNGKKAVWVDVDVLHDIHKFSLHNDISTPQLLEYFLKVGIQTVVHNPEQKVSFDLRGLKDE